MIEKLRIPKERLAILIGKGGEIKRKLEKLTKTQIDVSDEITIEGEAISVLDASNVIKAIGRGFDPDSALELLDEKMTLCIIPLPNDRKALKRIRSRIIGTGGKCKKIIERSSNTKLSVYGKTVSIIGEYENADLAKCAIEKLIGGSPHKNVYRYLISKGA